MSDEQRIERLEANKRRKLELKVDDGFARMDRGFAEIREYSRETRQDIRELRGEVSMWGRSILMMWLTVIFGFAGIIIAMLYQT